MTFPHSSAHTPAHPPTPGDGSPAASISFEFEGKPVSAVPGQSIAGALQATGVRTLSRSVKYHTPRGYTCGFGACGDCPLTVNGMPGTVSCVTPAQDGQVVSREQGFPTTGFDIFRTADLLRPWLGAGFQFRLFAKQPRLSKITGGFLALLAGGGRMPTRAAADSAKTTRVDRVTPLVAVIGGGISGLTAALAAAQLGEQVTVIDRNFSGGRSGVRTEPVTDGGAPVPLARLHADLLGQVRADPRITALPGIAIGWIDGVIPVIDGTIRTEVAPERVVIATGSYETPLLVPNHDRPGVMFADAALKLADVESVTPGTRAIIVTADERSHAVTDRLQASGVRIVEVVPAADVQRVFGWGRARGVVVAPNGGPVRKVRADLVVIAGPRRPADELALHIAYTEAGTHERVESDRVSPQGPVVRVGTSAGTSTYSLESVRAAVESLLTHDERGATPSAVPVQAAGVAGTLSSDPPPGTEPTAS